MIVHAVGLSASLPEMAHALSRALRGYLLVGRGERRDGKNMETTQIDWHYIRVDSYLDDLWT